jgi:hypothetical protein
MDGRVRSGKPREQADREDVWPQDRAYAMTQGAPVDRCEVFTRFQSPAPGYPTAMGMDAVRRAGVALECVLADGAYCSIERTQVLSVLACRPVIPAGERSRAWWQQDSVA